MTHAHEIPSDAEVCSVLQRLGDSTARALVNALVDTGHSPRDSQRAIQRCLDRGKITLGQGLRLQCAHTQELVAA